MKLPLAFWVLTHPPLNPVFHAAKRIPIPTTPTFTVTVRTVMSFLKKGRRSMVLLITIRESLRVHAECNEPLVMKTDFLAPRPAA